MSKTERKFLPQGDALKLRKLAVVACHACGRRGVLSWAVIDARKTVCSSCGCDRQPRVIKDGIGWGENFVV